MDELGKKLPKKTVIRIIFHAFLLAASVVLAIFLIENRYLHQLLEFSQGEGELLAAFVSGFFFASFFTAPVATASLFLLGQNHNPLLISLIAAAGSAFGDALILKFIKDDIIKDLEVLTKPFSGMGSYIFQSPIFHKPLAILAAIIIASPLPDELGITIMGLIKFKPRNFFLLSFALNFLGILAITTVGSLV